MVINIFFSEGQEFIFFFQDFNRTKFILMIDNVELVFVKNDEYNNVIYKLINGNNADMYNLQQM